MKKNTRLLLMLSLLLMLHACSRPQHLDAAAETPCRSSMKTGQSLQSGCPCPPPADPAGGGLSLSAAGEIENQPCLSLSGSDRSILPEAALAAKVTVAPGTSSQASRKGTETDTDALLEILESAADMQPGTAGCSLRRAELAGNLMRWLEDRPDGAERAEKALHGRNMGLDDRELAEIRSTLRLLLKCAREMETGTIRRLLLDAGYEITVSSPSREEFSSLLEGLLTAVGGRIFSNPIKIMNIFT